MNNICTLIKDLFPLYIEDLCSEESKVMIEQHISECANCKNELELLSTPDTFKPINNNEKKLIERIDNSFKKEKQKAVIKSILLFSLSLILVIGTAFLRIPLELAESDFKTNGYWRANPDYEEWGFGVSEKSNFNNEYMEFFINEKHGKYSTVVIPQTSTILNFDNGKKISILHYVDENKPVQKDFNDYKKEYFSASRYPFLFSSIKKGIEKMEFDSARFPNYDYRIYHTLIKKSVIELPLLCSPSEYNEACAFYGLFHTIVPLTNGYYILGENKKYITWGYSSYAENSTTYHIEFQSKENLEKQYAIILTGFSKSEAQELFESVMLK